MLTIALLPLITLFGYPGIFAVIFLESGVPFGFFLPGASLLFTAGILASQGYFNPYILIPLVTLAAVLGDNVGYWFGAKVGIKLFTRPDSRFFKHEHLAQAQHFYERHGAKTILLARFVPIVRTFAPIVAGIAYMKYRVFWTYNLLGAFLWATCITSAGWLLGERFPFVEQYLTPIIILIVLITTIPIFREAWKAQKASEAA